MCVFPNVFRKPYALTANLPYVYLCVGLSRRSSLVAPDAAWGQAAYNRSLPAFSALSGPSAVLHLASHAIGEGPHSRDEGLAQQALGGLR